MHQPASDWREDAAERIAQLRQSAVTITIADAQGRPLPDLLVSIAQIRHRFGFGTCLSAPLVQDPGPEGQWYRDLVTGLFSAAVDENHMKWYATEAAPGQEDYRAADAVADFCAQHRLALRGHCLFWDREKFVARQAWLLGLDAASLRQAVQRRLASVVPRYRGRVTCWDVNNEMLDGGWYAQHDPDLPAEMFRQAHRWDPGCPLFINEYGILGNPAKIARLETLVHHLRAAGAPVGGLGIQEHACERFTTAVAVAERDPHPERMNHPHLSPAQAIADLDRLALLGLPIHLTEISCQAQDPAVRAEGLETLFTIAFAHPQVEAILLWGFSARAHWLGANAALYDIDGNETLAGARIRDLLTRRWRTRLTSRTDAQGQLHLRGFHGLYALSTPSGATAEFTLDPGLAELCVPLPTAY